MKIPPSIFNAWFICKREAWLMNNNISGLQDNYFLEIGRLLSETTYEREKKEIYLADFSAKIDLIENRNGEILAAEIKKSSRKIDSAERQLKFYLYILLKKGIDAKGELRFPMERKKVKVELSKEDIDFIEKTCKEIAVFLEQEKMPAKEYKNFCPKCAHFEFCWA